MITKAALISSAIAPAFAAVGQFQSTVEPPPVRSSVWSVPRLVAVTKGCRSICASPVPGVNRLVDAKHDTADHQACRRICEGS
jgi:hypothetical protein